MRPPAVGSGQRYRPSALLGEDALGTLWSGTDVRSGSAITIRLLDERLTSEAQALHRATARLRWAQWESENVHLARVVDHSLRRGARPAFVVSEGSGDETLSQRLTRGEAPPFRRTLEVIAAVADGLASAHAARVYHGALTSASVLLDDRAVAKVVDIGLGELLDADERDRSARTSRLEDRGATDVLAVARLLERLLSGNHRRAHTSGELARGSKIPGELGDLIRRALSPHRLQRPSMAELAAALASDVGAIPSLEAARPDAAMPPVSRSQRAMPPRVEPRSRVPADVPPPAATVPPPAATVPPPAATVPPPAATVPPPAATVPPSAAEPAANESPSAAEPPAERAPRTSRMPRPPRPVVVALGSCIVVLGLALGGLLALRGTDAEIEVEPPARPTVTAPVVSVTPTSEPIRPATVPAVLGQDVESATRLIEQAGLVVGSVTPVPGREGVVVQTEPTQGEAVAAGTVIDVFVGSGAE